MFDLARHADRDSADVAELAALLARGFLRLTRKRRDPGVSAARDRENLLDVSRPESPPCPTRRTR